MTREVYVVGWVRTPMGVFGGSLKNSCCLDLAKHVIEMLLQRTGVAPTQVDEVIFGHVENNSGEGLVVRRAALRAGLPQEVPVYHVNRLCASGMQAIHNAADVIALGRAEVIIAGGVEIMSRYGYLIERDALGYKLGSPQLHDTLWEVLADRERDIHGAYAAENLARQYGITREEQDSFALESHRRAAAAQDAGYFQEEIAPVTLAARKGTVVFEHDETIRRDTDLKKLATLKTLFPDGTVTAGNACGINDGASAVLLASKEAVQKMGLTPLARVVSMAVAGVDPDYFGIGPVPAIQRALQRAGLSLEEIALTEINEAFAAQALAVEKELGLDPQRVNVNGGAIALGHALGNSGCRISITLLAEMRRRKVQYGISSLCVGYGMGIATVWEALY